MNKEMKFSKSLAHGIILAERQQRVSPARLLLVCIAVAEESFCHFTIRGLLRDVEEEEGDRKRRQG